MRSVTFLSQIDASALTEPHYVISISDKDEVKFACPHYDVLRLYFEDIEQHSAGQELFSVNHARQVLKWAKAIPDGGAVVVHCQAGVSRSAAIAKFLHDNLGYWLFLDGACYGKFDKYNGHVYGLLRLLDSDRSALAMLVEEEREGHPGLIKW
jgi:hypothetical protein